MRMLAISKASLRAIFRSPSAVVFSFGFPLIFILTDGGPEWQTRFTQACRSLGIEPRRTKPRHAWTNGFVERLQGTILSELWRVAFRRTYYTSVGQLERDLQAYLRFYNRDRPHQGYRLQGRTPASVFLARKTS